MKLKKEHLARASRIINRLSVDLSDMSLFFPLETGEEHLDEFGMPTTKYKSESFYGNQLLPGIIKINLDVPKDNIVKENAESVRKTFVLLAYAPTTDTYTFDLSGFTNIVEQTQVNEEDLKFILQFESCLVHTEKATLSRAFIAEMYPLNEENPVKKDEEESDEEETDPAWNDPLPEA